MKFIIPQNYDLNPKILGIIDYPSAILDVTWSGIIFILLKIIHRTISFKIFLFTIGVLPLIIFSIVGVNGENIIYVIKYMTKYIINPKVLLYEKENKDCKRSQKGI